MSHSLLHATPHTLMTKPNYFLGTFPDRRKMKVNLEIFKLVYTFKLVIHYLSCEITSVPVYHGMEADNKQTQYELNVMAIWNS